MSRKHGPRLAPRRTAAASGLQQLRIDRGLTSQQVATLIGVSASAVSLWEVGRARPGAQLCLQLARVYGVSADTLRAAMPTAHADGKGGVA